jgi:hypothetical protein
MVIHIDPNRINVRNRSAGTSAERRSSRQDSAYVVPKRSEVNYIPAPESLRTLIGSAVEAMRRGVYWDRGTILNLIV